MLKTDGAGVLLWANDVGGGAGDDWGAQVVESDATLEGDGTVGYELKIAQQGALDGQVLKWDSLGTWLPADDIAGDNDWSGAGTGMMYATHIDDNVGIGTVSPMHKLDVLGSVNISDSLFIGTVPFDFSHDMILTINGGRVMKYWADSICDNGWSGAGTGNIYATDTTDYVGIGTTAPSYKLDVHGMARITDGLYLDYLSEDPVHDTVLTIDGGQVKKVAAGALGGGASKYRWATHHQYSCNSPELTYIPINSEEDTTAISSRQVRWLAPCDGQLLKVVIMTDFVAGSTQVGFHTNMNSVATETQVVDITMSDTPFVAMFSTAVFNEGDMLHISVAPGADPGVVWVTCYYESN